jgi:hypothetical protein
MDNVQQCSYKAYIIVQSSFLEMREILPHTYKITAYVRAVYYFKLLGFDSTIDS